MKKNIVLLLLLTVILHGCKSDKSSTQDTAIIPIPQEMTFKEGCFDWNENTSIILSEDNDALRKNAEYLHKVMVRANNTTKADFKIGQAQKNSVVLMLDATIGNPEAYTLDVTTDNIILKANSSKGIFYGIQTLLQLMPAEVVTDSLAESFSIPTLSIKDAPEFKYRGMHLDVSRNFITGEEVKSFIDMLAMYKFNTFHWHLTDGAGWRIEIKKYPLLTQKAAFRAEKTWKEFWKGGSRRFVDEGTPGAYGGYYTQDEIRDIVAYAQERQITVIPEIEMPGHSEEVFVAYPHLSCSGVPYKDSDFCAGNEDTFEFIENVLTEVFDLFPSKYIHIGGDEAGKASWKKCPKCQKRMRENKLKNLNELQSYFIQRVSNFLTANNRKLIGWDEIVDGGLAKDATVMLWRDPKTAIRSAAMGHDVIMTPGTHCYFDSYQADPATEPETIGGYLPLRKVYSFNPIANDSLASKFIGGQGNIWTEYMPNYKHVEYMAFPRAIALSEALWSNKKNKNWDSFKHRLNSQFPRLDYLDINYHKPVYELEMFQEIDTLNKKVKLSFESEWANPEIRYTLDGSKPTASSPLYKDSIVIEGFKTINASIFKDGTPQSIFTKDAGYHLAVGKKVKYLKKWTSYPAGGETALTNGIVGGLTYSDGLWQGFTSNLNVIIDLEVETILNSFAANFMQLTGPGVYMPKYVEVSVSNDGKTFNSVLKIENDIPENHDRLIFKNFKGDFKQQKARFVKVFARNNKGFIFTDELILN